MSQRKARVQQHALDELADRAQDLAQEVAEIADRIDIMSDIHVLGAAAKLNRAVEACAHLNRVLLALANGREREESLRTRLEMRRISDVTDVTVERVPVDADLSE